MTEIPKWLKEWPDNVKDTSIMTASQRMETCHRLSQKSHFSSSLGNCKLDDARGAYFLKAQVDGVWSRPGAMINKRSGEIIKLAEGVTAEAVDAVLA